MVHSEVELILQCILDLQSQSIDLKNAFAQADIPSVDPVWIELPKDFNSNGVQWNFFFRFKKILYGQAKASLFLYKNLWIGLLDHSFVVSKVYPCLFMSKNINFMVYVDDFLFRKHL